MDRLPTRSERQIAHLEARVRLLTRIVASLAVLFAVGLVSAFAGRQSDVIRVRGIIVEDAAGRERILIGAPIPEAGHRVRTDSARVAQTWAQRFPDPDRYMGWYADYRHSVHGMLVLDENGFDRLAVGDSTPDPNIGKRIGPSTGMQINDAEGYERSGYGMLTVNGRDRVVLGLDSDRGTEGVTLSLLDGGGMGLSVYGAGGTLAFLGTAPAGDRRAGMADSLFRLVLKREGRIEHVLNVGGPQ